MKKIFTLLVMVALATCWTSCSDDDDKNEPDPTIPTMNEITLSIEIGSHPIEFFKSDYIGEFGEEWEEEILPYIQVPQNLEINWGDGQTTNSTTHQYGIAGTYQITIKGTNLTSFILEERNVKNINVTKAPNLVVLSLYLNEIKELDVSKNTNLTYLMCANNELSSLDISNNLTLKVLDCSDNTLSSLNTSKNKALVEIGCKGNALQTLDVSKNIALVDLWCDECELTSLDLSKNTALVELYCESNKLTSLNIANNSNLENISCSFNPFTETSFKQLLNDLPNRNNSSKGYLYIDNPNNCDVSTAENKGWQVN